jgi:ABC-type amino acid transport substrate-binding protein
MDMKARLSSATWRKSSHSGGSGNCVEVARDLPGAVGVRDSKDPHGEALVFTAQAWQAFIDRVKSGKLG